VGGDDAVDHAAETLPGRALGGEERLEDPAPDHCWVPQPGVLDLEPHGNILGTERTVSTRLLEHRSVDREVDDHLLDLAPVRLHPPPGRAELDCHRDVLAQQTSQQVFGAPSTASSSSGSGLVALAAREQRNWRVVAPRGCSRRARQDRLVALVLAVDLEDLDHRLHRLEEVVRSRGRRPRPAAHGLHLLGVTGLLLGAVSCVMSRPPTRS
jgi:hypothetical protein